MQSIKKSYKQELLHSRRTAPLQQLPTKPHGKPLLLGQKLDLLVQLYLRRVRDGGGTINTRIAEAAARGIVMKYDKEKLIEFGGHIQISHTWAELLLSHMNFIKCNGTTAKSR